MTTAVLERPRLRTPVKPKQASTIEPIVEPIAESTAEIEYPKTDGKPMAETGPHARATVYLYAVFNNLIRVIRKDPSVYLAIDMFLYYQKGNIYANRVPDLMLIKGVDGTYERDTFKTWVEHAVPSLIIEISSKSTWIEDMVTKASLYARLGVKEYFIFDPLQEYLPAQLIGFRLADDEYARLPAGDDGGIDSEEMEVRLVPHDRFLLVTDLRTGKDIPALEREHAAVAALEGELQEVTQRAEQEAQRAEQESLRAEQESQRAAEAEAENKRLRALLQELQSRDK